MIKILSYSLSFDNTNKIFLTKCTDYGENSDDILNLRSSYDEFGLYIVKNYVY